MQNNIQKGFIMRETLTLLIALFSLHNIGHAQELTTIEGRGISSVELEDFVDKQMISRQVPGFSLAIIHKGNVAYVKNFGVKNAATRVPVDEETIFEACSISKPVFAYFVLKQVEKGVLDLDKPLCEYYLDPDVELSDPNYQLLTARMVLCHASGLPNWRSQDSRKLVFMSAPGVTYGYSGEGYQLLARVLCHVLMKTDVELNDQFQEDVVNPLGIRSMNFTWDKSLESLKAFSHRNGEPTDNSSQGPADWFGAAGSLHTNARDYAKFLVAIMDQDDRIGKQLLELQLALPAEPNEPPRSMGFPHKIVRGRVRYFHLGNNTDTRAYCHFYQPEGIGVVMFGNCDNFFSSGFGQSVLKFLDEEVPLLKTCYRQEGVGRYLLSIRPRSSAESATASFNLTPSACT